MEHVDAIRLYHDFGFKQKEILFLLAQHQDCVISERHLRRVLRSVGLRRRSDPDKMIEVACFINRQLATSGRQHGYRFMHMKCAMAGLTVSRDHVRLILSVLDPEGVDLRRRRRLVRRRYYAHGPNYTWHMDSYDKLTPYGIGINGCVDGFSRFIIWLDASYTNSDPRVVGGYFVKALFSLDGCPRTVRADRGTENVSVERIQLALRRNHVDSLASKSFMYGKSTANTRIESMWGMLRKQNAEFWIELFQKIKSEGHFDGYRLDKELIRFCFLWLIQAELDEFLLMWNIHYIRRSRADVISHGRPVLMYTHPELYGTSDGRTSIEPRILENYSNDFCTKDSFPCDRDVFDLCHYIMDEMRWSQPRNVEEAVRLYRNLRPVIHEAIHG